MAMQNSDSMGRLIARELRSGNRYHPCGWCGHDGKPTMTVGDRNLCVVCRADPRVNPPALTGGSDAKAG